MENSQLKFQGFHPSDFTRTYLDEKMSCLLEEAPYGATLNASFIKKDHLYKGVITINSVRGNFFATATESNLRETSHKLVEQIRRRLNKWKSHRFERESLKDIPVEF